MAPPRDSGKRKNKKPQPGVTKKRKWVPERKIFEGSVKEGRGFAFKRKEKVRHEYNKLLRKERKTQAGRTAPSYQEQYPEHLKHLYLAEEQKLKSEAWTNRVNRSKHRLKGRRTEVEETEDVDREDATPETEEEAAPSVSETKESLPMSNRMRKRLLRKTSFQKTKDEFEKAKEKKRQKKEKFLLDKKQREEAIERYQKKKQETFQMLCKKTKKGQPNLNLQMEYLLQKIQKS
ncbi:thyroid transcription factor 1-associated protein 26 homolog [Synchiropus splendidus]|uniref:thyroid transcription factor 1-associated protein 26 homolog n=1 Tax=Synchiropus splendidus TaxID=270530 RepID=UPI00237D7584|nr:thyroid transcription factor 1-associated protein 26 homolog [Synchiropus splendidus]